MSAAPKFKNPRARYNYQGRSVSITGVGAYVPAKVLTNFELAAMVDTNDEWITSRTGIKERRIAAKDEFTSDLAAKAAQRAMKAAGVTGDQIDLIIVATITPDMVFPSTACLVQQKIGALRAAAFDLEAACSGFIYGLEIAQQFIMSRTYDTVLVIGAEKLSSIVDWQDRNTCVLFGDGAGAAVLQNRAHSHGLLTAVMGADGSKAELLHMPGGGSRCPATVQSVASRLHYLRMEGKETYKHAVQAMRQCRHGGAAPLRSGDQQDQVHHPAPGQPPHHRRRGRTPRRAARPTVRQLGSLRQHVRGLRCHRIGRSREFRPHSPRRSDSARGFRGRFDLGCGRDRVVGVRRRSFALPPNHHRRPFVGISAPLRR